MFNFFKIDKASLKEIIRNTAAKKDIDPAFIEKDMWVCFILNYLFEICKYKSLFTFTGGTCLSKCYHVINRFSEDIDIAIKYDAIGQDDEVFEASTISQRDRIVKKIKSNTEHFLKNEFMKIMNHDLIEILGNDYKFKLSYENESIFFHYPMMFKDLYIDPRVKIEIGALGIMNPRINITLNSYIGDIYRDKLDCKRIKVKSIILERIFWDKVTILHQEAHRSEDKKLPPRNARHYYDLYCLGQFKNVKNNAIKNHKLLKSVIESKNYFYYRSWAKYEECLEKKIKLLPPLYNVSKLKDDYKKMAGMFLITPPSFDKILDYLKKLEKELNE